MAQARIKKHPKNYKYTIIGSDITAQLIALELSQRFEDVLLIESANSYSDFNSHFRFNPSPIKSLNFLKSEDLESAQKLAKMLGLSHKELFETSEDGPFTFEEGQFKSFLGFGKREISSADSYSHFNESQHIWIKKSYSEILSRIEELYTGERISSSSITSLETEDSQVTKIIINGSLSVESESVIFVDHPKDLASLLEDDNLIPAKARQKMSKSKPWSTLHYSLTLNKEFTSKSNIYFLMSSKLEDEICLGRFFKFNEDEPQQATWMTLIHPEHLESVEYIGGQLKYMKRQIKRAFPDFFDHTEKERITLEINSFGPLSLDLKTEGRLPKINNLYLASPLLQESSGWAGIIESVAQLLTFYSEDPVLPNKIEEDSSKNKLSSH